MKGRLANRRTARIAAPSAKRILDFPSRVIPILALGTLVGTGTAAVAGTGRQAAPAGLAANAGTTAYHTRFMTDTDQGIREVEIEGNVRFSADESGIEWLGDDARVRIVTQEAGRRLRFEAAPDGQGRPVVRFAVDGRERSFDDEARRLLASTLPVVFRELGHGADARVRSAHAQGGAPAVVQLVAGIRSAHSARIHYDAFLQLDALTDAEICLALSRLGEELDADAERESILQATAGAYQERPGIRGSYLACLARFESAAERARVTRSLFGVEAIGAGEQPPLSRDPNDC